MLHGLSDEGMSSIHGGRRRASSTLCEPSLARTTSFTVLGGQKQAPERGGFFLWTSGRPVARIARLPAYELVADPRLLPAFPVLQKLSLPPPAPAPPPAAPPAADEPPSSAFKHSKDLTMIDSPSSSSSALLSQPTQAHKPHVAASIAAETIIFNAPAHIGLGQPKGHGSFMKPKGFEVAPPSSSKSKSKKRKSGEVEPAAGGGLLRLGELGLAELVGDKGVGAGEEEEKKKHGRKNKDRKRARKEAEMRGGG